MKMERWEGKSRLFDNHASSNRISYPRLFDGPSLSRFPLGRRKLAAALLLPRPRPSFRGQHRPKLPPPLLFPPGRRASPPSKLSPPLHPRPPHPPSILQNFVPRSIETSSSLPVVLAPVLLFQGRNRFLGSSRKRFLSRAGRCSTVFRRSTVSPHADS